MEAIIAITLCVVEDLKGMMLIWLTEELSKVKDSAVWSFEGKINIQTPFCVSLVSFNKEWNIEGEMEENESKNSRFESA